MIDRLPEFRKLIGGELELSSDQDFNRSIEDLYNERAQGIDPTFFQNIKAIKLMISKLNANNHKIPNLRGKYGKAIKSTQEKDISEEMNQILVENSEAQKNIKHALNEMQKMVKIAEKEQPGEPETKMKKNYYLSMSKMVSDVLKKQQSLEDQYKHTVKTKVSRQVRLIDPTLDEERVQEYMEKPQLAQDMLQKKMWGQASVTLKSTVSDIQDKFRDIKRLESSVNQCVELFNQLSNLVQAQGEKLDSIELNVADTKNYVQKAEVKLKEAKQHHKCSKKCMCTFIIIGLVAVIVVIIVVLSNS